jgi:hypothetical protein
MILALRARRGVFAFGLFLVAGSLGLLGQDAPADPIAQADAAYMTRYLRESMTEALALYEKALPGLEALPVKTQAYVLNRLSQLCYEAAMFTEGNTPEDKELFIEGKEYGYRSLRLNEEFVAHEGAGLQAALEYVTDAMAMHWTANNWGMLLEMNPVKGLIEQGSVMALFERTVEVDEDFWGGSAASALGSLLIMVPGIMGGNAERGLALVERSIEMAPTYLHNRIILAEYWGFTYNMFGGLTGVRDAELIRRETAIILESEIGDWPFWNRQAKIEAERLLAQLEALID